MNAHQAVFKKLLNPEAFTAVSQALACLSSQAPKPWGTPHVEPMQPALPAPHEECHALQHGHPPFNHASAFQHSACYAPTQPITTHLSQPPRPAGMHEGSTGLGGRPPSSEPTPAQGRSLAHDPETPSNTPAQGPGASSLPQQLLLQQQQQQLFAHLSAQQRRDSMTGRPLRGRVGSVASISEEDLFSSTGGMELGHEGGGARGAGDDGAQPDSLAPADVPSRTLFVQNVPPDAAEEDIRLLFAAHGELRSLYTACKHRGFVLVGYYDLRAAMRAAQLLQGALLGGRALEVTYAAPKTGAGMPLRGGGGSSGSAPGSSSGSGGALGALGDVGAPGTPQAQSQASASAAGGQLNQGVIVVYNLDPETTNDQLAWIFNRFGDVKEIRESTTRANQKFIEFYDVRHAAAALRAMNRAELAGLGRGQLPGPTGVGTPTAAQVQAHAQAAAAAAAATAALEQQQAAAAAGSAGPQHASAAAQALAIESVARQAATRGMVRPASQAVMEQLHASMSPRLSQGPLSQSWDPAFNPDGVLSMLRQQQAASAAHGGAAGSGSSSQAPQTSMHMAFPPLHHQQHHLYNPQAQAALQQALQASGFLGSMVGGWGAKGNAKGYLLVWVPGLLWVLQLLCLLGRRLSGAHGGWWRGVAWVLGAL